MRTKEAKAMIEREFADHIAVRSMPGENIEILSWRKKDRSSIYHVHYILNGGHLYVSGDMGSLEIDTHRGKIMSRQPLFEARNCFIIET